MSRLRCNKTFHGELKLKVLKSLNGAIGLAVIWLLWSRMRDVKSYISDRAFRNFLF